MTLDGSGSAGDIDSISWTAPDGVTLTGADQAKATFTGPGQATSLKFTLTVKSGTQTVTDEVVINVKAATPASAQIAPVGATVLQNLPLTLDASASVGAAKFEWSQVPTDATKVTLNGDTTSSKLTFLFPKTATPIHMQVRVRSASDPGGTACSAPDVRHGGHHAHAAARQPDQHPRQERRQGPLGGRRQLECPRGEQRPRLRGRHDRHVGEPDRHRAGRPDRRLEGRRPQLAGRRPGLPLRQRRVRPRRRAHEHRDAVARDSRSPGRTH